MAELLIILWLVAIAIVLWLFFKVSILFLAGKHNFSPKEANTKLSFEAKALIGSAFNNIPFWVDYHLHLIGLRDENIGWVNPKMQHFFHPLQRLQFELYWRAAGIKNIEYANAEYVQRLIELTEVMPSGKTYLLAMDKYHTEEGVPDLEKTSFYVANEYVWQIAQSHPAFAPMISIHPYRKDAIATLEAWYQKGARYIKWLPNSMGIDPSNPKINDFYAAVKRLEMVILTHTGVEEAVEVRSEQEYGNPLLLKRPLEMGVKIIMAHVGSLGKCVDLESGSNRYVPCFDLTLRLLDSPHFQENLFADISGITLINRPARVLHTLLSRQDLHHRLVYGSDYPICAVNVLVQTWVLLKNGFITRKERALLSEIYQYNPLLFDLVLKRTLKLPETGQSFAAKIFSAHPLLPS